MMSPRTLKVPRLIVVVALMLDLDQLPQDATADPLAALERQQRMP
jgi:hypothetical protein